MSANSLLLFLVGRRFLPLIQPEGPPLKPFLGDGAVGFVTDRLRKVRVVWTVGCVSG